MLEYGMTKRNVLEEIFPDEVGFLLDEAERRKRELFREMIFVQHGEPKENLKRLDAGIIYKERIAEKADSEIDAVAVEKSAMQLAIWSGNYDYARKVLLYKRAQELKNGEKNG